MGDDGERSSSTSGDTKRPRWAPQRVSITPADMPVDKVAADLPDDGVSPLLLNKMDPLQAVVASLVVGRLLRERGLDVTARMHSSGLMFLEHHPAAADERTTRGFVVAAASSMEPRPIWPMLLPLAVPELVELDWIAACSVPKLPALEALDEDGADAFVLGWLDAEAVTKLPIVAVEAHLGHDFPAQYRQAKNHQLRPLDEFPD
jgi:hypothetical protein